jgi:hypothetical protein
MKGGTNALSEGPGNPFHQDIHSRRALTLGAPTRQEGS